MRKKEGIGCYKETGKCWWISVTRRLECYDLSTKGAEVVNYDMRQIPLVPDV